MNCTTCEQTCTDHADWCEYAPMPLSKRSFVDAVDGGVRAAIESYKTLLSMGFTETEALESVIHETRESASCFAGIGTCGAGGCKH